MNGKQVRRMDQSLDLILKLVYDMMFEKTINLEKGFVSTKLQQIRSSHKRSELMSVEIIEYQDYWVIHSESGPKLYEIKEAEKNCQCQILCDKCNVCLHNYSCDCEDYLIRNNLCKHIHYFIKYKNEVR